MWPSRRELLRAGGLSLAWLGGCGGDPDPDADTPTPIGFGSPSSPEPTITPGSDSDLRCGSGPLPGAGWPYPAGSWGRTNYASTARDPTEKPSVAWSAIPAEPENTRNRFTRPIVADGRVFVGRRLAVPTHTEEPEEQGVMAFDAASGRELWQTFLPRAPGPTTLIDNRLIVGDGTAVHALASADGRTLWTTETGDGVVALQPTPVGVLVVTHPGGQDQALLEMATDGSVSWRVTIDETVATPPAWAAERAYLVTLEGRLIAIDTGDATIAWTGNLQNGRDRAPASVIATPCATFAAIDGVLYAVNRAGGLVWSADAGVRELATDGDSVYGVGGDGYVRAFAVDDGTLRWEESTGGFYDADPAVDARSLYAGWRGGALVRVATDTGQWQWTVRRDWEGPTRVVVVGSTLYVAWGRRLVAFR